MSSFISMLTGIFLAWLGLMIVLFILSLAMLVIDCFSNWNHDRKLDRLPILFLLLFIGCSGCTMVSNNRVFPKLTWAWTAEAKEQRKSNEQQEQARKLGQAIYDDTHPK